MATGSFNLTKTLGTSIYMYSRCDWYASSNQENNESELTVMVMAGKNSGSNVATSCTFNTTVTVSYDVDGTNYSEEKSTNGQFLKIYSGDEYEVFETSFTIEHDSDGKQEVKISVSIGPNGVYESSGSQTVSLDEIPRETELPPLSTGYVEDTYTLAISPKIANAYHSFYFQLGNTYEEASSGNGLNRWLQNNGSLGESEVKIKKANPTVTFPKSYYDYFDGATGYVKFALYTYQLTGYYMSGVGPGIPQYRFVGEKSKWLRINCSPSRCSPVIDATAVDVNEATLKLTGDPNVLIANASNILITPTIQISDADDTNAWVTSKKIDNTVFTTDTVIINGASKNYFDLNVTNNRSLSTSKTIQMTGRVVPYVPLTFNISSLGRPEPTTGEVVIEYGGNYYPGEFTDNLGESTQYIKVGNEMLASNISLAFPDNLYLSMGEVGTKVSVLKTDAYELYYEVFYPEYITDDNGELVANTSKIAYAVTYQSLDGNNSWSPYYVSLQDGELVSSETNNETSLLGDLGMVTEVNDSDNVVYPYITKIDYETDAIFNTISLQWYYRKKSDETFTLGGTLTPNINTEKNTYSGTESLGTIFDYKSQYEFYVSYQDKIISKVTETKTVPRGFPIFWWSEDAVHIIGDLYVEGEINPTN